MVVPSLAEGSALVTYEARACGCVLLVSDASGAICEHTKDGLVHKAGDVNTLSEHIKLLASDFKFLDILRANSLAGLPDLTWDKAAQVLAQIYRRCLA